MEGECLTLIHSIIDIIESNQKKYDKINILVYKVLYNKFACLCLYVYVFFNGTRLDFEALEDLTFFACVTDLIQKYAIS